MTTTEDPPRLSEDPSVDPEVGHFMRGLRADLPSEEAVESLSRSVETRIRGGPGAFGALWKLGVGIAMLTLGVGLAVILTTEPSVPPATSPSVADTTSETTPAQLPSPAPLVEHLIANDEAPIIPTPQRTSRRRVSRDAREPPAVDMAAQDEIPSVTEPSPEPAPAETEVSLLARARRTLRRDPARTLELVEEHQARFPSGQFIEEREVLAIDALVALGRQPLAEARALRFRLQFPNSVHSRHVDEALAAQ